MAEDKNQEKTEKDLKKEEKQEEVKVDSKKDSEEKDEEVLFKPVKRKKRRLILKLFLAYIAVYIGLCVGYAAFSPHEYEYRDFNWLHYTGTVMTQPVMELFADGKVSRFYDFEEFEAENQKVNRKNLYPSKSGQYRKLDEDISYRNFLADFGKVDEAAVVKPINYKGKWSLAFCDFETDVCKKSNLLAIGEIKVLVDGDVLIWGLDEDENPIELTIEKYIDRDDERGVLLI